MQRGGCYISLRIADISAQERFGWLVVRVDGKRVRVDGKGVRMDGKGVRVDGKGVRVDGIGVTLKKGNVSPRKFMPFTCTRDSLGSVDGQPLRVDEDFAGALGGHLGEDSLLADAVRGDDESHGLALVFVAR
eukprot:6189448-Pyramimonas_sp.AAC.2